MVSDSIPRAKAPFIELFHHRWCVPVLAEMGAGGSGARFVALRHVLGASRDSLAHALSTLERLGLVERNPGYGHPLRPEYVLTAAGRRVAGHAAAYREALVAADAERVGLRKWTSPVLLGLADGHRRFNAIQGALEGITPRALTAALRLMDAAGLILRRIDDGYPPRAEYFLSPVGNRLACAARRLAESLIAGAHDGKQRRG